MERRHIFLTKIQIQSLNRVSKKKQIKTSELIRRIVDKFLEEEMVGEIVDVHPEDSRIGEVT